MFLSNGQAVASNVVDTIGDATPMYANPNYYGSSGVGLLNSFAAYGAIYRAQLWVNVVVRKRAHAAARMPFEVKGRINDTDSVNENGPMQELMGRPNGTMSGYKLWEWTCATRDVYGEAFWLKLRDRSGRVRELHPMHPTNVIARRLDDGTVGYLYTNGTANQSELPVIPQSDVVAFTTYNPENTLRGLSPLEALRMTLLNEDAARRATASMWAKGARPAFILTTERSLTPGAAKRLKDQFDAGHAGADQTGSTVVFEEGLKAQTVQLSAEEMQYIESRKMNREEVAAAYDMPAPAVGILDHATFSNITEQLRSLYRDTMAGIFVDFESVIDHQLVPDFYPDEPVFTRFNMEEVLRGDFETKATAASMLRNNGVATGNEVRAMFQLARSSDPNMDKVFVNSALQLLGTPAARVTITEDGDPPQGQVDPPERQAALEAAAAAAGKAVVPVRTWMGRIGRAKQAGLTVKTWQADPSCVQHTGMAGETVPLDQLFSNGARVPNDGADSGHEAGCTCNLAFA